MKKLSNDDLRKLLNEGIAAADMVVRNWEKGSLAAAVNDLADWSTEASQAINPRKETANAGRTQNSR